MTTGTTLEGFTLTPHLNSLYDECRTIDYGLLSANLYSATSIRDSEQTITIDDSAHDWLNKLPEPDEEIGVFQMPLISENGGTKDEWEAIRSAFEVIANTKPEGVSVSGRHGGQPTQIKLDARQPDSPVPYRQTIEGIGYFAKHFQNSWVEEIPGNAKIEGALGELINLQEGGIRAQLTRFLVLAYRLTELSSPFWARVFTSEGDRLKYSYYPFHTFNRQIALNFLPANTPIPDKGSFLCIGSDFLETYDLLANKKVIAIEHFIKQAVTMTGVKPRKEILKTLQRAYNEVNEGQLFVTQQAGDVKEPKPKKTYPPPLFLGDVKAKIYATLSYCVSDEQQGLLSDVLSQVKITERIWVKRQSNSVVDVFLHFMQPQTPDETRPNWTQVSHWLAEYFSFDETTEKPIKQSYAYDVLAKKVVVSEGERIPIRTEPRKFG